MKQNQYISMRMVGVALVAGVLEYTSAVGYANGLRNPPESAAGLGSVGTRYTLVDDASAMAFNPASMAEAKEPSAMISLEFAHSSVEYTSPLGASSKTADRWLTLPDAFIAYPVQGWVVGVGITTPFGQSTEWEKDSVFQFTAPYFAEMKVINVNPTIAKKLTDTVMIGVGLDVFWSQLDLKQLYPWGLMTGSMMDMPGVAHFKGEGEGVGANIGLTWKISKKQTLGLAYRSPVKVDYDGDFEVSNVPASLGMMVSPRSDFKTSVEFPDIVGLGYAVRITDDLSLGAEVEWIQFSRFDSLKLDVGQNAGLLPASIVPENWDDSWTAGIGAVWRIAPEWTIRGGYIFMQSPVPDETLAPTLPDSDQHVISTGLGYRKGPQTVDLSYGVAFNEKRTISNNVNPAYNGEYDVKPSHMVQIAYGISF